MNKEILLDKLTVFAKQAKVTIKISNVPFKRENTDEQTGGTYFPQKNVIVIYQQDYSPFLLAHEIGHFVNGHDSNSNYNFTIKSNFNYRAEKQANRWAIDFLVQYYFQEKDSNYNYIQFMQSYGIPGQLGDLTKQTMIEYLQNNKRLQISF